MKLVFSKENRFEVIAMRSFLESHGVPSVLKNEFTSSVMGEVPFFETWPEIWVADEMFQQAEQLVAQVQSEIVDTDDWLCSGCKEENPSTFEICWCCGGER